MNSKAPNCILLGPWKAIRTPFLEVSLLCDQGIDWGGGLRQFIFAANLHYSIICGFPSSVRGALIIPRLWGFFRRVNC